MNRIIGMMMLLLVSLSANKEFESPTSPKAQEGKSVYVPIREPINSDEEIHIQQCDQNGSRQDERP